MGKVIGLMTAWAAADWIVPAIHNHLKICDRILVYIGPFHRDFKKFDIHLETFETARDEFYNNSRVIFLLPNQHVGTDGNEAFKCSILLKMLRSGIVSCGDIAMICDVDEFYDDNAIAELQEEFLKEDWDQLNVVSRFFCINMGWYVRSDHPRFFQVNSDAFHFVPTQKPIPLRKSVKMVLENNPMFHYSMLMGLEFKRVHWQTEKINFHPNKLRWLDELYAHYDPNDIELCKALGEKNKEYFGCMGFWLKDTVQAPADPPYLFKYEGEHPSEIENSPMRHVKDFR
jgi:hypothetical protein